VTTTSNDLSKDRANQHPNRTMQAWTTRGDGIDGLQAERVVTTNATNHGVETGSQEMYGELAAFVDRHHLVPVVDRVFPVDQIHDALRYLEQGQQFGKVVLSW
jgi:NADPH:quinone reductase-like Zn-dependent oxidoreductase